MIKQLAGLFTENRHPGEVLARRAAPVLVWDSRTARSRPRRPSLQCVWRTDPGTGRPQCRWITTTASEASAIEPDPSPLSRDISDKHRRAA
jgi:hypothetical protein